MIQRLNQGTRALLAFARYVDYDLAARYLSAEQLALFRQMRRGEQLHSLNVLRTIIEQQASVPNDLVLVALLHDVGKIQRPLAVWEKSLAVIIRRVNNDLFLRWRRVSQVMTQHSQWGAQLVAKTGASERAVWLIAHHDDSPEKWQNHPYYELLKCLQIADELN